MYVIESVSEIPTEKAEKRTKYPFADMKAPSDGLVDTFHVPAKDLGINSNSTEEVRHALLKKARNSIYQSARTYGRKHDKHFIVRVDGDGVRVWRDK